MQPDSELGSRLWNLGRMLRGELGASRSGGNYNLTFKRYVCTVADRCPGSQSLLHNFAISREKLWRD